MEEKKKSPPPLYPKVDQTQFLSLLKFHKITAERTFYHKLKGSALTAGNKNSSYNSFPTNLAHPPEILKSHIAVHRHLVSRGRCILTIAEPKGDIFL